MGAARVDVGKFDKSYDLSSGQAEASSSRLLNTILDVGGKLANQLADRSIEEAYLDGVAKAGTIKEEGELQGNPLTRDWQVAGFRDTMGKLAAADREAQIALDMKKQREVSPEKFNEYLSNSRKDLLPKLDGMSFEQRKSMFAQQVFSERAAIKKHSAEHYEYQLELRNNALNQGYSRVSEALAAAKKPGPGIDAREGYKAATDTAFAYIRNMYTDRQLQESGLATKLLPQFAGRAIEEGNFDLYNQILNTTVEQPDGSKRPMADALAYEDRIKLSKAYTTEMQKTEGIRNTNYIAEVETLRGQFENPAVPMPTYEEVRATLDRGMQEHSGYMTQAKYGDVLGDWQKAGAKRGNEVALGQAFETGNVAALHALGGDAPAAWMATVGRKLPPAEATRRLARIGLDTGQMSAFKIMGDMTRTAWNAMATKDKIDPEQASMIDSTLTFFSKATGKHMDGALTQYLTAFTEEERAFILSTKANHDRGLDGAAALSQAKDQAVEFAKMSPGMRNAMKTKADAENAKLVSESRAQGPLDQVFNAVVGFMPWGVKSKADQEIAVQKGLLGQPGGVAAAFFGSPVVETLQMQTRPVFIEVLEDVTRKNPGADADQRLNLTKARMAEMSLQVKGVPVFVPMGQTPQSFFGVKANSAAISRALEQAAPASNKANVVSYTLDRLGNIKATEYNKEGGLVSQPWIVDPNEVRSHIDEERSKREQDFNTLNGEGITMKLGPTKDPISFNGDNSANIDNRSMLEFRKDLILHEGYKNKVYADLGGRPNKRTGKPVQTVGIGLSDTNDWYPKPDAEGRITPQQAQESFIRASDDAARIASRVLTNTRVVNDASFKLWADLAYQAGGQVVKGSEYRGLREAMAKRDVASAQAALKETLGYKMAGSDRREYRLKLLQDALKG